MDAAINFLQYLINTAPQVPAITFLEKAFAILGAGVGFRCKAVQVFWQSGMAKYLEGFVGATAFAQHGSFKETGGGVKVDALHLLEIG